MKQVLPTEDPEEVTRSESDYNDHKLKAAAHVPFALRSRWNDSLAQPSHHHLPPSLSTLSLLSLESAFPPSLWMIFFSFRRCYTHLILDLLFHVAELTELAASVCMRLYCVFLFAEATEVSVPFVFLLWACARRCRRDARD
ncbi:hypothetical protein IE53DRAFT_8171 [Violaceomyces palustris]|uniref:Uncharacterized protein n=1 Tax=Violaceomyces palustris TaxID=1673888 RepID=A0ACD0P2L2_9BASI|nr:hypothetical protein IE53DRAFT_8171 [Violaceomyces palustris]